MYNIGIKELASNAIIYLLEEDKEPFVSYDTLVEYGMAVYNELQHNVNIFMSSADTSKFYHAYNKYFHEIINNGNLGVKLNKGVTIEDLRDCFVVYLTCDVYNALRSERAIKVLVS